MWRLILMNMLLFLAVDHVFGQEFQRGESLLVQPLHIMPDQFTMIRLPETVISGPDANRYDNGNPYTYMELLFDSRQKTYQVIYQTDFFGKMLFLGISNNLSSLFMRKDKPMFLFQSCIRDMNRMMSPVQVAEKAMQCLIDRLNYCKEP